MLLDGSGTKLAHPVREAAVARRAATLPLVLEFTRRRGGLFSYGPPVVVRKRVARRTATEASAEKPSGTRHSPAVRFLVPESGPVRAVPPGQGGSIRVQS